MAKSMNTLEYRKESIPTLETLLQLESFSIHPSEINTGFPEYLPHKFLIKYDSANRWIVRVNCSEKKPHFFEKAESSIIILNRIINSWYWTIQRANTRTVLAKIDEGIEGPEDAFLSLFRGYFLKLTELKFIEANQPKKGKFIILEEKPGKRELLQIEEVWKRPGTERDIYSSTFDYDLTIKNDPRLITSSLDWHVHEPEKYVNGYVYCFNCMSCPPMEFKYSREKKVAFCIICADWLQDRLDWDSTQWL